MEVSIWWVTLHMLLVGISMLVSVYKVGKLFSQLYSLVINECVMCNECNECNNNWIIFRFAKNATLS